MAIEESAREDIIRKHLPYIRRICAGFTDDPDELNDLVQEVSIQVWKSLKSFQAKSKITTWIYRITVNMCLYHVGKEKKKTVRQVRLSDEAAMTGADLSHDSQPNAMAEKLYEAIRKLKPINRAVIMLYLDKSSYEEIAEITGLTQSNIGVKINRTKIELKKMINNEY